MLFFSCSLVARAQETVTQQADPQAQNSMHQRQHADRLDWLTKQLNLTDEQKAKIKPILANEEKQMRTVREDTSLSQQQKHDRMMQLHDTADSQINDVLTPEQQKKFTELEAQQKMHHEGMKPKQ